MTILDARGERLEEGDRVMRDLLLSDGQVEDRIRRIGRRNGYVFVRGQSVPILVSPTDQPDTYRCPDLTRLDNETEDR